MVSSSNRRIVKNTGFLYIRMLFTMAVTLYTSRVVLNKLGVDDYGIYSVVGGVVTMLSFLKGALSNSTSRFLAFELGQKKYDRLRKVFSSTLTIHFALAVLVFILAETVGLWFVYNKLVIPPERMSAAIWTYHFSILTVMVTIIQVPYNATIIAHERMNVYAYISIIEVTLKLLIVFFLSVVGFDKLKTYAVLMFLVSIIIALVFKVYCVRLFKEQTRYTFIWDKAMLMSILNFSGWSLTGNFVYMLLLQGGNIILNMFFGTAINASRAISVQVYNVIAKFVTNFRIASNPQIIKLYAENDLEKMKTLVINTSKFSYYLLLFLVLPVLFEANFILRIWLGIVPDYAAIFLQLTLINGLASIFDTSLYSVFIAMGRLKENAIISPLVSIWVIPIAYVLYTLGYSPTTIFYLQIVKSFILSFIIKPILLRKYANYEMKDFIKVFLPCLVVTFISILPVYYINLKIEEGWVRFIFAGVVSVISVTASVFVFGLNAVERKKVLSIVTDKVGVRRV